MSQNGAALSGVSLEAYIKSNYNRGTMALAIRYYKEQTGASLSELQQMMKELQRAIIDGDVAAVKTLCMKVLAGFNERNRVCKLGK